MTNELKQITIGVKIQGERICICGNEKLPQEPKCAECCAKLIEKNRQAFIALQNEPKKG